MYYNKSDLFEISWDFLVSYYTIIDFILYILCNIKNE